eukprot:COSAG05_NODE_18783_length_303_cov_0.710784_1_plen_46_part_10
MIAKQTCLVVAWGKTTRWELRLRTTVERDGWLRDLYKLQVRYSTVQ